VAERLGLDLWIKRDDVTGGAEGGCMLRKAEFLAHDALRQHADVLVTGGHVQSDHARVTALVAAMLGFRCELALWSDGPSGLLPRSGNAALVRASGAHVRLLGPVAPSQRASAIESLAEDVTRRGLRPYAIPEGGASWVGTLGYVQACREMRRQLDVGLAGGTKFGAVVIACGSGGCAAGLALGAAAFGIADEVIAVPVEGDVVSARCAVGRLIDEVSRAVRQAGRPVAWQVVGAPVAEETDRNFAREMACLGLVLDPRTSGRALRALANLVREDGRWVGKHVLFVHTGGLSASWGEDSVDE
jgi:D-cysteine desulfhydrase